jgi:hypothetical protein
MKTIVFLVFLAILPIPCFAQGLMIYDREWNKKGHIQDGKIYDRDWKPRGRIENGKVYDQDWRL